MTNRNEDKLSAKKNAEFCRNRKEVISEMLQVLINSIIQAERAQ